MAGRQATTRLAVITFSLGFSSTATAEEDGSIRFIRHQKSGIVFFVILSET